MLAYGKNKGRNNKDFVLMPDGIFKKKRIRPVALEIIGRASIKYTTIFSEQL
jgi:hypothetical protein